MKRRTDGRQRTYPVLLRKIQSPRRTWKRHLFEQWGPGVFSPNVDVGRNADRRRWNLNSERRTSKNHTFGSVARAVQDSHHVTHYCMFATSQHTKCMFRLSSDGHIIIIMKSQRSTEAYTSISIQVVQSSSRWWTCRWSLQKQTPDTHNHKPHKHNTNTAFPRQLHICMHYLCWYNFFSKFLERTIGFSIQIVF